MSLLDEQPDTIEAFRHWCEQSIDFLEDSLDEPDKAIAANFVNKAKVHAYRLTAYDLADVLPARDEKNPVDALLRLRECLAWIQSPAIAGEGPYTAAQAASLLGLSPRHIYDLCSEGSLACQRHGRAIRITREQLDEYQQQTSRRQSLAGFVTCLSPRLAGLLFQ